MIDIFHRFNLKEEIISTIKVETGLINTTYKVITKSNKYTLQRINNSIFSNPNELMNNISLITNFLKNNNHKSLDIIRSREGELFITHKKGYWRLFKYINGQTFNKSENIKIVNEAAKRLATFHRDLYNFPIHKLHNTIPYFHNTTFIFKYFKDVLFKAPKHIKDSCINQINYILGKESECNIIQDFIEENKLPIRVCHNDPKISNFIFDSQLNAICIIDLDTLMPTTILNDISDSIRSLCVSETEDESDLKKIFFKYDYFDCFIESYFSINKTNLNYYEINNISLSIELIFLEQGIRFLTDFLNGNIYFNVDYEEQNLVRATNQIFLSNQVFKNKKELDSIIRKYAK